ncbi:amidohydrolase family protein [Pendulispora albinea]|uniref:Amidohydrolase n=1 Tax=Pendulispora albinea TaxID=2741071 RepID=A0ABZ2LRU8_9BACT
MSKTSPEEPLRLPIKLDATTNGEYEPQPPSERLRWVMRTSLERASETARRLGMDRRAFLRSSCGAATVLLTLNELGQTGCGGHYAIPDEAQTDPAAAAVLEGDEFIFDVQTHHVATNRPWWKASRPTLADFILTTPQAQCGRAEKMDCFGRDVFLKEVFLDSDTQLAVLSALWGTDDINAIHIDEEALTRRRVAQMEGSPRLRIHGIVLPKDESHQRTRERMHALAERWKISAWKLYPVWTGDSTGYRLDDPETGLFTIREGLRLGVDIFAVHKGLPLPGAKNAFTSPIDVGPAAKAAPDATFLIYHSGYEPSLREGPYNPNAEKGVDALIRSLEENDIGKHGNVYAELGSVWRELMKDPEQAAHLLGKLLKHLGEDRILWGTDAIWYGSPQDQIQAFRAFQISEEFQERYGYPALTPRIKRKIFGWNGARVYGVDIDEVRRAHANDAVARERMEYRNDPRPSFRTYGPRTRRELFELLRDQPPGEI